jgi:hypothetical protein
LVNELRSTAYLELDINNKGKITRNKGTREICCYSHKGCLNAIWFYKQAAYSSLVEHQLYNSSVV